MVKVEGHDDLLRDKSSAIVSSNKEGHSEFMRGFFERRNREARLGEVERRMDGIEHKVDLLTDTIKDLINKLN